MLDNLFSFLAITNIDWDDIFTILQSERTDNEIHRQIHYCTIGNYINIRIKPTNE